LRRDGRGPRLALPPLLPATPPAIYPLMPSNAAKIKPTSKPVKDYYAALKALDAQGAGHEGAVRSAFQSLLAEAAKSRKWTLIAEFHSTVAGRTIIYDAVLRDANYLPHGHWEAKDSGDDIDAEIKKKIALGYSTSNIIFENTATGVLYQDGHEAMRIALSDPKQLCRLLDAFLGHVEPDFENFETAVAEFRERVPELARGLVEKIREAHKDNPAFIAAFAKFFALCQNSLNPNISEPAVDEMLVQHLLTGRLFSTVFDNPDFAQRNVIAREVEGVIDALVSRSFSKTEFLKSLNPFYAAIESAARGLSEFSDKQHFLNTVYEQFFQGYSVKVADTHGIVYTPQPIVDFMCASVEEVLKSEFGLDLCSPQVQILDPCTGTANFIVNLLRRMDKVRLKDAYRNRLFANEVMLMPYYIAALNVEHAYYELTGNYEPFEGLCFVDTLDMVEHMRRQQGLFISEQNAERVKRQQKAKITVIIGNPPYNVGQLNENDNNKNRKYEHVDERIRQTYVKDSSATNKNSLYDAYVRFFRWASDRLGNQDGILCFVSNNGFLNGIAFDGFRKHMEKDFSRIYHFDFKGNARTAGDRRQREGGNIFDDQIRVGVGISLLVRKGVENKFSGYYYAVDDYMKAEEKRACLLKYDRVSKVPWQEMVPDAKHSWLVAGNQAEFDGFMPTGTKEAKGLDAEKAETIFATYGRGVATCRDEVVYDFNRDSLIPRVKQFIDDYNAEVGRYKGAKAQDKDNIDNFVHYDRIQWSESLKHDVQRERYAEYDDIKIRSSLYRPFCKRFLFFDRMLNERVYVFPHIFPTPETEKENRAICSCAIGVKKSYHALAVSIIPDLHLTADSQCFPFYVYNEDGTNRRENVTDWALGEFRRHYGNDAITKRDIFHYVYAVLHHPGYRERYAECLKRELPRIPFAVSSLSPSSISPSPTSSNSPSPTGRGWRSPRRTTGEGGNNTAKAPGEGGSSIARGDREASGSGRIILPPSSGAPSRRGHLLPRGEGEDTRGAPSCGGEGEDSQGVRAGFKPAPTGGGAAGAFRALADAGRRLAELHVNYEDAEPWPLKFEATPGTKLSYAVVDKMRLNEDGTELRVNDSLTLRGIPPEAHAYRLGNRSAIEWVVDQYQVKTHKRSGIVSDPNRRDDEKYIVNLVGKVVRVSMETVKIVGEIAGMEFKM